MRLWSISPGYLDRQGLLACWREALLAQAVLLGNTKGYRNHPQLIRFRQSMDPMSAIGTYLEGIHLEATSRGYHFDGSKIASGRLAEKSVAVTRGQAEYELQHLRNKLLMRSPEQLKQWPVGEHLELHRMFYLVDGPVESWEVVGKSAT